MKHWRIHATWAAATLVLSFALGNLLLRREKQAARQREKEFQECIDRLEAALSRGEAARAHAADASRGQHASQHLVEVSRDSVSSGQSVFEDTPAKAPSKDGPRLSADEIRALIRKGDRNSSMLAARSIAHLGDLSTELALVRELFAFGHPAARYAALVIGDEDRWPPEAADLWCVILREGEVLEMRARAASTLGRMGNPAAIYALEDAFRNDQMYVQTTAAIALENLGRRSAREEMIVRLAPWLDDPDGALREQAVLHLGELRTASSLPHLGRALTDSNSNVRWKAVQGLEKTRLKEAIPYLERALLDPNASIAQGAKRAIETLEKPADPK